MDSFYRDCARVLQDLVKVKRDETGDINPQSVGWAVCPRSGGHVMAPPTKECAGTTTPFLIPTDTHILAVGSHVRGRQTIFKKGFLLNLSAFPCAKWLWVRENFFCGVLLEKGNYVIANVREEKRVRKGKLYKIHNKRREENRNRSRFLFSFPL